MKSDILKLGSEIGLLANILAETEKAAAYCGLDAKQTGRLRLLAEELCEMLPELLSFSTGEFWVESEGKNFELHTTLVPKEALSLELREKLLDISSSGKNAAAVGIIAKIRIAAEFLLIDYSKASEDEPILPSFFYDGKIGQTYFESAWSLKEYRKKTNEIKGEKWDELERSIIANIADEVLVGIQGSKVEVIVKKTF